MDITHFYRERGCGFPLVMLHGNSEESGYFAAQMEPLGRIRRVIAPDSRGHGMTPRGTAPLTVSQLAEDVAGFMDRLGIPMADILGFSDGANIAMELTLAHPEKVRSLILDGGNLCPRGVRPRYQIPVEAAWRLLRPLAAVSRSALRRRELLGLMVRDPHIDPKDLHRICCPTLVMAGSDDMIREAHTRLIAESIPGARLSVLKGGHFIAAENPQEFNMTVAAFLQEIGR